MLTITVIDSGLGGGQEPVSYNAPVDFRDFLGLSKPCEPNPKKPKIPPPPPETVPRPPAVVPGLPDMSPPRMPVGPTPQIPTPPPGSGLPYPPPNYDIPIPPMYWNDPTGNGAVPTPPHPYGEPPVQPYAFGQYVPSISALWR